MKALLRSKGLWRVVDGKEPRPAKNDAGEQDKWDAKADKAAGEIMLNVEADRGSTLGPPRTILSMPGRLLRPYTSRGSMGHALLPMTSSLALGSERMSLSLL